MKYKTTFFLFCLVIQNVLTSKTLKNPLIKLTNEMKKTQTQKKANIASVIVDDYVPAPIEEYVETGPTESERANATAKDAQVEATKPVSTNGYTIESKGADMQIFKFHSFQSVAEEGIIGLTTSFYFLGGTIPFSVIYRLRITYNSRLRNLQTTQAESVRADCLLIHRYLDGKKVTKGEIVDYSCTANATQDASNAQIQLNTDVELVLANKSGSIYETKPFSTINFVGNAVEESKNIQNCKKDLFSQLVSNTIISMNGNNLIFEGDYYTPEERRRLASKTEEAEEEEEEEEESEEEAMTMPIIMDINTGGGNIHQYNCTSNVNSTTYKLEVICDTSSHPIDTKTENLHLSTGVIDEVSFVELFEVKDGLGNSTVIQTGGSSDSNSYREIPSEEYNVTAVNQPETGNATAEDAQVNASKPVSTNGYTEDEKESDVQIMKFHSYDSSEEGKVKFNTFFYFAGRRIPHRTIFRLRITYSSVSTLRNLVAAEAYSARTDCFIVDTSLEGNITSEGEVVDYSCSANKEEDASIAEVELNTDFDLILAERNGSYESYDFDNVSFTGNSSEEARSIQSYSESYNGETDTLTNVIATIDGYILILTGELASSFSSTLRRLSLKEGDIIEMNLKTKVNGTDKIYKYNCTLNEVSPPTFNLTCDTSKNPIDTNAENLHLSTGRSGNGTLLTIKLKDWKGNTTSITPARAGGNQTEVNKKYNYRKSSSGLSGGAIAGIVIACVATVAALALAVFLLKKPSVPQNSPIHSVNNSTEVHIKAGNS